MSEFGTSGLARSKFCRIHEMTLSTLQRGLKRERIESGASPSNDKRLVRVKVIGGGRAAEREGPCAMAVVLANGRRIELNRHFDAAQLRRVVEALEGF